MTQSTTPGPLLSGLKFLQSLHQMADEKGNAYNLTTFDGLADLCTLFLAQTMAEFLDHTLRDGPVKLKATSFGATSA